MDALILDIVYTIAISAIFVLGGVHILYTALVTEEEQT